MKTTIRITTVVALIALLTTGVGPAVAQDIQVTPTPDTGNSTQSEFDPSDRQRIDSDLVLLKAEVVDGSAVLHLKAEQTTSLTIVDAGAFSRGGRLNQRTSIIREGRTTIRFPITTVNGQAGVSLSTPDVVYAVPLKTQTTLIGGPWTAQDVQIGALAGAFSVSALVLFITWRKISGRSNQSRRLA